MKSAMDLNSGFISDYHRCKGIHTAEA